MLSSINPKEVTFCSCTEGTMRTYRSSHMPVQITALTIASERGERLVFSNSSNGKGIRKLHKSTARLRLDQGLSYRRKTRNGVSSGRLAYQIGRYWHQNRYVHKMQNPKISFPRSWLGECDEEPELLAGCERNARTPMAPRPR